jgi:DNA-binding response OmpR family regulator
MQAGIKNIFIADDDSGIVDAVSMMLEMVGYHVASTLNGEVVPAAVEKEHSDLILLDIWMSGHDGREICKNLKSNISTQNIPVLMISASRDVKQSALDAGADDFLEKPFEMEVMLNKVARLISIKN